MHGQRRRGEQAKAGAGAAPGACATYGAQLRGRVDIRPASNAGACRPPACPPACPPLPARHGRLTHREEAEAALAAGALAAQAGLEALGVQPVCSGSGGASSQHCQHFPCPLPVHRHESGSSSGRPAGWQWNTGGSGRRQPVQRSSQRVRPARLCGEGRLTHTPKPSGRAGMRHPAGSCRGASWMGRRCPRAARGPASAPAPRHGQTGTAVGASRKGGW